MTDTHVQAIDPCIQSTMETVPDVKSDFLKAHIVISRIYTGFGHMVWLNELKIFPLLQLYLNKAIRKQLNMYVHKYIYVHTPSENVLHIYHSSLIFISLHQKAVACCRK